MTTELHTDSDERQSLEQAGPSAEPPPAAPPTPPVDTNESRRAAPPPAAPPAPPQGRLAARVQQMSPGGRWALGLGLAFLSGMIWLSLNTPSVAALSVVVTVVLALAAGFVLSRWWAVLALAVVLAAGAFVGAWLFVQLSSPGAVEGLSGMAAVLVMLAFFAIMDLVPLILFLVGGVGLGKLQGLVLGQPHALSEGEARTSRWLAALAPVVAGGALAHSLAYLPGAQFGVWFLVSGILTAVVLAATCLLAGWLLRAWWGLVVAPVVYAGVAALAGQLFGGIVWGYVWSVGFALYIVLPAVVMSAIGTAIGMYRAGQSGPRPRYGQFAT